MTENDSMNLTPQERTMPEFFRSEDFQNKFQKETSTGNMASFTPLEKENIVLKHIQYTIGKHGCTLEKVAGPNQFKVKHPDWMAKDRYFWLDDEYRVCCDARNSHGLTAIGLNPVVLYKPEQATTAHARQVGGDHYKSMKIQPWEVMRAVMTREEYTAYQIGTVLAYLMRHKVKGGEQDIKKAHHHLTELVEYLDAKA